MQRRRFVQLGIAAVGIATLGFVVSGLSRLVVEPDTAIVLGAPLLLVGFGLAILAFVIATLAWIGVVELETEPSAEPGASSGSE